MEMKKYLKNGNIIECRNRRRYVVMNDGNFAIDATEFIEDLENVGTFEDEEWDIMKIYHPTRSTSLSNLLKNPWLYCELVWERTEKKEMTVAEISKALGYEVKIVKE
jgi:hypothetical protein